jgi:hypothetical protein
MYISQSGYIVGISSTFIDIFIFDVEGGELEALQAKYWNIPGDFRVIELDNSNPEKDRAVSDLLLSKGYLQSKWDIGSACTKGMDCSSKLLRPFLRQQGNTTTCY